jgi:predicted RNase H-like HicB family nuclease
MAIFNLIFSSNAPVYEKDTKSGGWIAYYKKHKGIIGQGYTKKEALANLEEDIKLVEQLKQKKEANAASPTQHHRVAHS